MSDERFIIVSPDDVETVRDRLFRESANWVRPDQLEEIIPPPGFASPVYRVHVRSDITGIPSDYSTFDERVRDIKRAAQAAATPEGDQ